LYSAYSWIFDFDTPEFPQILAMVQAMTPQSIQVVTATESGDKARWWRAARKRDRRNAGRFFSTA
jgi:hypothetical protein